MELLATILMILLPAGSVCAFSSSFIGWSKQIQLLRGTPRTVLNYGGSKGEYYGESGSSAIVREFSLFEQLQGIVKLSSQPLPERPDGVVCVVKYTSSIREDCKATEAQYERLARDNPATIFLRCFEEYDNSHLLLGKANVQNWPTYDIFYGGIRVQRIDNGPDVTKLQDMLNNYQFQNSKLDLFSESSQSQNSLSWGDGKRKDPNKTPRTTNRFIPGYDWNTDKGFFDDAADKAQDDFENQYGNWLPNIED